MQWLADKKVKKTLSKKSFLIDVKVIWYEVPDTVKD
jgi:hypothetical protein